MVKKFFSKRQEKMLIVLLIPLTIILQSFLKQILPAKYFYDSNVILRIVAYKHLEDIYDNSYVFIARLFRNINVFSFTDFMQWAYMISIIAIVLTVVKLSKKNKISIDKIIFIYLTIILQNMYVYRISKDIVQAVFFVVIDIIIISPHIKEKYKAALVVIVLVYEASVFRYYYNITAAFFLLIYVLFKNMHKVNVVKVISIFLIFLCLGLICLQKFDRKDYNELVYIRVKVNGNRDESPDAVTAINDVIKSKGNVFLYLANYFVNLLRALFPIELVTKGVKYIPFIIYQMYISINIIKQISNVKNENLSTRRRLLLSIFMAYFLVATLYEPDFGSFIRHESTLAFIMFDLIIDSKEKVSE